MASAEEAGTQFETQAARAGCHAPIVLPADSARERPMQPDKSAGPIAHRTRRSYEAGPRPKLLVPVGSLCVRVRNKQGEVALPQVVPEEAAGQEPAGSVPIESI
jgi:hypothetical protein